MLAADLVSTGSRLDTLATFSSANDRSIRARSKAKKPPILTGYHIIYQYAETNIPLQQKCFWRQIHS